MEGSELDVLVLQYLQRKGYSEAERALRKDLDLDHDPEMSLASQLDVMPRVAEGLARHTAESDPEQYLVAYDQLATWIDNSLDMYRGELQRLLYPLFIHCYLQLVEAGATASATQLMARCRRRLVDLAGRLSGARALELQELASVAVPQHMSTNRTAKAARAKRFTVRLCTYSYELLMNFLKGTKLWVPLGVINAHVKFEVTDGLPVVDDLGASGGDEGAAILGQDDTSATATNQQPIRLGLLQDKGEAAEKAKADEAAAAAAGDGEDEAAPKAKRQKAGGADGAAGGAGKEGVGPSSKGAAKSKRKDIVVERITPSIPLLPVPEDVLAELAEHARNRADVGPSSLPSCCMFSFFNTRQALTCCTFNADGSRLAGGCADSTIRLYDVTTLATPPAPAEDDDDADGSRGSAYLHGHSSPVHALDFSSDQRILLSASSDGSVRLWSTELAVQLAVFRGHMWPVWDVAASPLGWYFASGSSDRTARLWCTERLQPLRIFAGHQSDVDVVAWHPNGHYLATGSSDRTVRLWDVASGNCVRFMAGQQASITSLALHPEGRQLASGGDDGSLVLWDLESGRKLGSVAAHEGPVWSLAYSNTDGAVLASGGADATLRYWGRSPASGTRMGSGSKAAQEQPLTSLGTYPTRSTPVFHVQFTPRNLLLASGALTLPSRAR